MVQFIRKHFFWQNITALPFRKKWEAAREARRKASPRNSEGAGGGGSGTEPQQQQQLRARKEGSPWSKMADEVNPKAYPLAEQVGAP